MNGDQDRALTQLLAHLKSRDYEFTTPTPATHARVIARIRDRPGRDLRSIFGWSLEFDHSDDEDEVMRLLRRADMLENTLPGVFRSKVRVSTLDDDFFLHSAYPTTQHDAVFFGPDSYRFAAFIRAELPRLARRTHIVDIGAGSGVGAIVAARVVPEAYFTLTDVNMHALRLAAVNWVFADLGAVMFKQTSALDGVSDERPIDCIIANPPYIADDAHRAYRDGGAMHGAAVSLAWARAAAERLERGGALLLYTGSAIVAGRDIFKEKLRQELKGFDLRYRELDPDVFGEELEREDYADVDRIAVVGVVAVKP